MFTLLDPFLILVCMTNFESRDLAREPHSPTRHTASSQLFISYTCRSHHPPPLGHLRRYGFRCCDGRKIRGKLRTGSYHAIKVVPDERDVDSGRARSEEAMGEQGRTCEKGSQHLVSQLSLRVRRREEAFEQLTARYHALCSCCRMTYPSAHSLISCR